MWSESILDRKGCPLHYWTAGPQSAPLVIFLHGAWVDHHSFDTIAEPVAEHYRVLLLDVRGHGKSQPAGEGFNMPLAVEDTLALMDALGYEKAALVGHSNGTYIAQELVFRHPERVTALALADGTCITWPHSAFDNWLVRISPAIMALYPIETLKKLTLPTISDKKELQEYVYQAYSQLSRADFLAIWRGVSQCMHAEPGYHIPRPLLLVWGEKDPTGDIASLMPKWAAYENCQVAVIPNAKHFAIRDDAPFFTGLLLEFLDKWVK
jgi:3-oxoadipate enol-lactonase